MKVANSARKAFVVSILGFSAGTCDNKIGNANVKTTIPVIKNIAMSRDLLVPPPSRL